jgi:hypothetical protein
LLVTAAPVSGYYPTGPSPAWDRKSFQPYVRSDS